VLLLVLYFTLFLGKLAIHFESGHISYSESKLLFNSALIEKYQSRLVELRCREEDLLRNLPSLKFEKLTVEDVRSVGKIFTNSNCTNQLFLAQLRTILQQEAKKLEIKTNNEFSSGKFQT
jgi:hypothetical protein